MPHLRRPERGRSSPGECAGSSCPISASRPGMLRRWRSRASTGTGRSRAVTPASTAGSTWASRRPASTAGRAARRSRRSARTCASIAARRRRSAPGFRACKRCRPDASPGSPEWNARADVVARAMRLIGDGVVDREGVTGLAAPARLQRAPALDRLVSAELGAGPLALARAQRAQTARTLIETTRARIRRGRVRGRIRERAPVQRHGARGVRAHAARAAATARQRRTLPAPGRSRCGCAYRAPLEIEALLEFFASRAISGVEEVTAAGAYRRTLRLPHGTAIAELAPGNGCVRCSLRLGDVRDLGVAVARCRRLLDLDADPASIADALARDRAARTTRSGRPRAARPRLCRRHGDRRAGGARPADLGCRGPDACRAARTTPWRRRWPCRTDR